MRERDADTARMAVGAAPAAFAYNYRGVSGPIGHGKRAVVEATVVTKSIAMDATKESLHLERA